MTGDPCRPFADGSWPAIAGPVNIPLRSDASRDVFSVRGRLLIQYCIPDDNARIYSARGDQGFPRRRDQRGAGTLHRLPCRSDNPARRNLLLRYYGRPQLLLPECRESRTRVFHRCDRHAATAAARLADVRRNS